MDKISEELERALHSICQHYDKEDQEVRDRQIRLAKKLKYFWDGISNVYWSQTAHDWRVYDQLLFNGADNDLHDAGAYDKRINVFKAFLETVTAALSVSMPTVVCYPDDADNPEDLNTAKCGNKIYDLVAKHNDVMLLWIHALFILCTEGTVFAYNYTKEDESYGTYEENEYKAIEEEVDVEICSICKKNLPDNSIVDEYDPSDSDVLLHDLLNEGMKFCDSCAQQVSPEIKKDKVLVDRLVGVTSKPKARQCIEAYGVLFVKVAVYAQTLKDSPYLTYSYETTPEQALSQYGELREKWTKDQKLNTGTSEIWEAWGRTSTQYMGSDPTNLVTIQNTWLRKCSFERHNEDDEVKELKKLYPFGCKIVRVNGTIVEICPENLDDHWTATKCPLTDYIYQDPLGSALTSIQEITNDLVSLTLQTIEHGIPQTFADPGVLNFDAYGQLEARPGMIYKAKPAAGKSLKDAFYEIKTANLSSEVLPFSEKIQESGQFVSGALPSLSGGAAPNSSKTAAQYAMSRAQAMQRLQTTWKMLCFWWKDVSGKFIPAYIKIVLEQGDEKLVIKNKEGNFINVHIRKSELQGRFGSVELEASEELPTTWAQKRDVIMQLMQSSNPLIFNAITSPENLPVLQQSIGLHDFILPGTEDREKQLEEIRELLEGAPIPNPMNPGEEMPSVDIEPLVDNNALEAEICKRWLKSDAGRLTKVENPNGYKNVLLHMKRHMDIQQALAAMNQQKPQGNPAQPGEQKPMVNSMDKSNVSEPTSIN